MAITVRTDAGTCMPSSHTIRESPVHTTRQRRLLIFFCHGRHCEHRNPSGHSENCSTGVQGVVPRIHHTRMAVFCAFSYRRGDSGCWKRLSAKSRETQWRFREKGLSLMRGFQGRRALTQINLFDGSFDVRFKYLSGEKPCVKPLEQSRII